MNNCYMFFFFFSSRRRHTRCSRDWSSDVCSSDLAGLVTTLGTDDLPGFIFFGALIGGLLGMAFWGVAFAIRMEMDTGTLEATWLTPTHHVTGVVGRGLGSRFWFALCQLALFAFGVSGL